MPQQHVPEDDVFDAAKMITKIGEKEASYLLKYPILYFREAGSTCGCCGSCVSLLGHWFDVPS